MSGIGYGRSRKVFEGYRSPHDPQQDLRDENTRLKQRLGHAWGMIAVMLGLGVTGLIFRALSLFSEYIEPTSPITRTHTGTVTIVTDYAEFSALPRNGTSYRTSWRGLDCMSYCNPGWRAIMDCSSFRLVCYLPPHTCH